MTILRKDNPEFFEKIIDDMFDESYSEHRRGSSFYTKWIYKIDEKFFPDIDSSYYGFWESNSFIHDTEYGHDKSEITILTKVERKEVIVKTIEWLPVK